MSDNYIENKIKADGSNTMGKNIRRLRILRGFTNTELSKREDFKSLGLSREALVKIESGKQHISVNQLRLIARIFDCDYDDILDEPYWS